MEQYYAYVNLSKKEYFHPHDFGVGAKAIEQFDSSGPNILTFLLIKTDGQGGGDISKGIETSFLGHWAGDSISIIGDYDFFKLYFLAVKEYKNIGKEAFAQYLSATN